MTSRLVVLAAGAAGAVVVVLGVVAVAREQEALAAAAAGAFALGVLAVQLDTWRRVRGTRTQVRQELARHRKVVETSASSAAAAEPTSVPGAREPVGAEDLRGALTMMQTQHAARLDRLQTALDLALADLTSRRSDSSR